MVDVTPDKLTKAFLKIRAERAVLQAEFKEKEAVGGSKFQSFRRRISLICNTCHNLTEPSVDRM